MPLIDVSTSRVIKEVHDQPIIWNTSHELYRSKHARKRAWQEVITALLPEFKTMTNSQKMETDRAIQQRWKTARDAYMRNKAHLKAKKNIKKYFYYDNLSFLDSLEYTKKPTKPTETEQSQDSSDPLDHATGEPLKLKQEYDITFEDCNFDNQLENSEPDYESNNAETADDNYEIEFNNETEGDYEQNELNDRSSDTMRPSKRKLEDDLNRETTKMLKEHMSHMQNDDMAFFMSMLPMLSNFTVQQKLMFRSKVIDIVMEMNSSK